MNELVEWLRAVLDDDIEGIAALESYALNGIESTAGDWAREYVERTRAEVEAKRRIVAEYEAAVAQRRAHPEDVATVGWWLGTIRVLELLALPYADRDGYREEWRPEW